MATRWVLHPEVIGEIPTEPLLRDLAEDVARDAEALAPMRTGALKTSVHIDNVFSNAAYVQANPRDPKDVKPEEQPYAYFVEKGTSRMAAQPFLRPALYKYRSP